MFDLSFAEIAIIAAIAVVFIGPKELPRALATAGKWMGKARGIMANFRSGLDAMVREAELQEMEEKWASENKRIMLEHPTVDAADSKDNSDSEDAGDNPQMEPLDGPPVKPGTQSDLPLGDKSEKS